MHSTRVQHAPRQHTLAALQALFVAFLWSTSWVLIKIGMSDLDLRPISFAGLRYAVAAAILLPFGLRALRASRARAATADGRGWLRVVAYGLILVTLAQGGQYVALAFLPATAVSLVLASTPVWVAAGALATRAERATGIQLVGIATLTFGAVLYFGPFEVGESAGAGFAAAALCVAGAAFATHLGRALASGGIDRYGGPVGLTATSMAVGAVVLLAAGVAAEGWPNLDLRGWAIIGWLAAVNTAFAFTLYNHTLRTLTAVESSVVTNTMTIQIAILAVIFLGERLGLEQVVGLVLAAAGAAVVQLAPILRPRRPLP